MTVQAWRWLRVLSPMQAIDSTSLPGPSNMRTRPPLKAFFAMLLTMGWVSGLHSQAPLAPGCRQMFADAVQTRVPSGDLSRCGPDLPLVVAEYLARAPYEPDVQRLANLLEYGSGIRDQVVLAAAWSLIDNRDAPSAARNLGLLFAIRLHDPGLVLPAPTTRRDELVLNVPDFCVLGWATDASFVVAHPLDPDELHQTYLRASRVIADSSAPKPTRRLAGCIVRTFRGDEERPDYSHLRARYVCGHTYQLTNSGERDLPVSWRVYSDSSFAGGSVPAHGKLTAEADDREALQMSYTNLASGEEVELFALRARRKPCPVRRPRIPAGSADPGTPRGPL